MVTWAGNVVSLIRARESIAQRTSNKRTLGMNTVEPESKPSEEPKVETTVNDEKQDEIEELYEELGGEG